MGRRWRRAGRGVLLAGLLLPLAACAADDAGLPPPAEGPPAREPVPGETPGEGGALDPSRSGDAILPGVILLDPALDREAATATFRVRNASPTDLPDLILAVVFAVPSGDAAAPLLPRFVTLEAPLVRGETAEFRATLPFLPPGGAPTGFRVVAGMPELLAAAGGGRPGTTFLGGLLECVELEADLTSESPRVAVGLAGRGAAAGGAALPPLEGQLLVARGDDLLWTGAWVVLPRDDPDGGPVRRVQWNLAGAPGLAGTNVFLRIRERR